MGRVFWAMKDVLLSLLFLIPLFLLYTKFVFVKAKKAVVYLLLAMYLVAVYSLVGLPNIRYLRWDFCANFIPFVGMADSVTETLQNVLLFVPLGFFLPVLCERYRKIGHTIAFGFGMTAAIELLQIFTFRATDINDVITNVIGTILGYGLAKVVTGGFHRRVMEEKSPKNIALVLITVMGVMFLAAPWMQRI